MELEVPILSTMDPAMVLIANMEHFAGAHGQDWVKWLQRFQTKTVGVSGADRLKFLFKFSQ